jgi:hypothetical protein
MICTASNRVRVADQFDRRARRGEVAANCGVVFCTVRVLAPHGGGTCRSPLRELLACVAAAGRPSREPPVARLVDMVEGRSKHVLKTRLDAQTSAFREGIEVVATDGFTGFKSGRMSTAAES